MALIKAFLAALFLTGFAFSGSAQDNNIDSTEFFEPELFAGDTLYLKVHFMECGEWGGHLETSEIYTKGKQFYLEYNRYAVDCNTIKENNGVPAQILEETIVKELDAEDIKGIRRFFHQFIDAKFSEPVPMHAGHLFELKKSDNSLRIRVYTWGATLKNHYLELINEIIR